MRRLDLVPAVFRVRQFLSWMRYGNLNLTPRFQRRHVWKPKAQSLLIDTVVRGLPIPPIYLREVGKPGTTEPLREVVDGQQRLIALMAFIERKLLLGSPYDVDPFFVLEAHNDEIYGKPFLELPEEAQNQILDYQISVQTFPVNTDDRDILEIFARLNSTGTTLNGQELRNANYHGVFKQAIYAFAYTYLKEWRAWGVFSEDNIARMQEVELISDVTQMMLVGLRGKSQKSLDDLYKEYDDAFPQQAVVRVRLAAVMDRIGRLFPDDGLKATRFRNGTLFQTLFTHIYDKMYGLDSPLVRKRADAVPETEADRLLKISARIEAGDYPDDLRRALSGRTTHLASRRARLRFVRGRGG